MKKIFRSKKAVTTKEHVKALEEFTEQNKSSNNNCPDGEHCQLIVEEEELGELLAQGWRVASVFSIRCDSEKTLSLADNG